MNIQVKDLIHTEGGDPGDFISITSENCTLCKKCLIICPVNLWIFKDSIIQIQDTYKEMCLECGSCEQICDFDAIHFKYPNGGTGVVFKRG